MTGTDQSITVTGYGSVAAAPDRFTINIGIEASRPSVREAYAQASDAMNAVQVKLLSMGIAKESVSSSSLDVRADTRWQEGAGNIVSSYTVSSTLSAALSYDQGAEEVLAAVVDTGDNHVRIHGLTPEVSDPFAAQDAARGAAWADARRAAQLYAGLAGRTLGAVAKIVEGDPAYGSPRPMMARATSGFDSTMMISPGQNDIAMAIKVTWLLA